jgi:hypothetical protein
MFYWIIKLILNINQVDKSIMSKILNDSLFQNHEIIKRNKLCQNIWKYKIFNNVNKKSIYFQ